MIEIVDNTEIITLGSLFDGIGGFPYAASLYGIKTLWASEIIPAAISVTRRHFPDIEHMGDITKLNGSELAPVHIITFGSPCQSFSIAGQRLGLEGKSGLFWEAIRIIKEMREATNGRYPRYCVFENVPGILSANKGRDYKTVLEAFTEAEIPLPPSGKWTTAGMVRGGRIDVAWVIHDAQHFGVAQRRRRLFAVCDFTGQRAAEILFKPKSLHRNFTQSGAAWERITPNAPGSVDNAEPNGINAVAAFMGGQSGAAGSIAYNEKKSPTLKSGAGGNMVPCVCKPHNDFSAIGINGCVAGTLDASYYKGVGERCGVEREVVMCAATGQSNAEILTNLSATLNCNCEQPIVYICSVCKPELCCKVLNAKGDVDASVVVVNDQGGDSLTIEKTAVSPTLRSEAHGNLPIVSIKEAYPINTQVATRHKSLGKNTGFGIGENGDPAYTLQEAHSHAVAALGVNQNADGDVRIAETAYALTTSSNASGRNAPLVCHPEVTGTLVASGAGLSRPAGLCNETDLCIVTEAPTDPNPVVCGTLCAKSIAPNGICNELDMCILQQPHTFTHNGYGHFVESDKSKTILSCDKSGTSDVVAYCLQGNMIGRQDKNGPQGNGVNEEIAFTLSTADRHAVAAVDCRNMRETEEMSGTLQAKSGGGGYSLNYQNPVRNGFIVRRLTPVECERLQGYPDGWTEYGHDNKPLCDTARYQALGNSVAIPCVAYVLSGIVDEYNAE